MHAHRSRSNQFGKVKRTANEMHSECCVESKSQYGKSLAFLHESKACTFNSTKHGRCHSTRLTAPSSVLYRRTCHARHKAAAVECSCHRLIGKCIRQLTFISQKPGNA